MEAGKEEGREGRAGRGQFLPHNQVGVGELVFIKMHIAFWEMTKFFVRFFLIVLSLAERYLTLYRELIL